MPSDPWARESLEAARRAAWDEDDWDLGIELCLEPLLPVLDPVSENGGKILEIGCGPARLLRPLAERWPRAQLIGLDTSRAMLDWAAEVAGHSNVRFISDIAFTSPNSLSAVYSVLTFQHLPVDEQCRYISAVATALRPGGVFMLQFVPEGDVGPLNHPVPLKTMQAWCASQSLELVSTEVPVKQPTWRWITVRKP